MDFSSAAIYQSIIESQPESKYTLPKNKYNILFVCDFFYPNLGGVEMHIYQLGQCLIERGHKVVVLTNMYWGERTGVRYMTNGLKVYYMPLIPFSTQDSFINIFFFMPILRQVLIREKIDVIHGHQATSVLNLEALFHGKTLGMRTVFTDHSLFGFADAASVHINKTLKWILTDVDAAICVSHINKENLALRAAIPPQMIYVIQNAVDCTRFTPDPTKRYPKGTINIVVLSRLHFRKGIDMLVDIIPKICREYSNVHFIIGGDGPKRAILEQLRKKYQLEDRMEMLGSVPHAKVREVLCRGHIFLNTSLTEAFCIAILEAASCGLMCVSTNVGGIPEILPPSMLLLAPAKADLLCQQLENAIKKCQRHDMPVQNFHDIVSKLYNWRQVATRVERVYEKVEFQEKPTTLGRIKASLSLGPIAGIGNLFFLILDLILLVLIEVFQPQESIDVAYDFDYEKYIGDREVFGDHSFRVSSYDKAGEGERVGANGYYKVRRNEQGRKKIALVKE